MPAKKRFFTKNKKKIIRHPRKEGIGNKSVITREKEDGKEKRESIVLSERSESNGFPKNSQKITEWLFYALLLLVSLWQGIGVMQQAVSLQHVLTVRSLLAMDLVTWEQLSQKYPGYRDAYFQAAVLAYRLGERQKEIDLLQKVLQIDPQFTPARDLLAKQ